MKLVRALLVYPKFPLSYWGFQYALRFVGKKSSMPPLGLLTVAGMFPDHYELTLVDMNVEELTDAHLEWADVVFTSTMVVQEDSLRDVVRRCNNAGVPVVAGGPHPTSFHDEMDEWDDARVNYFVLGEVEETLPFFLQALEAGRAERFTRSSAVGSVSVAHTPVPRFDLLRLEAYGSMAIQFSRGCPFDCEFCDITKLYGRVPRTKSNEQMLAELDVLYELGWRGAVFLVDDNFIGNKRDAMRLLPAIARWQKERGYPFSFYTEASVNLAQMDALMEAMVGAGFTMVFLGIETPNPKALQITKKGQNVKEGQEDFLLRAVLKIQHAGMQVTAGFILGLDGDTENAFDAQIHFVQDAGIPMAMVGLLTALKGTDLWKRYEREGRLRTHSTGNNVEVALNFTPEMDEQILIAGYKRVLQTLYDPTLRNYFRRCLTLFRRLPAPSRHSRWRVRPAEVRAFLCLSLKQGFSRQGPACVWFLTRVLLRRPRMFREAVTLAVKGYHFERVTSQVVVAHDFREYLEAELLRFREFVSSLGDVHRHRVRERADRLLAEARRRYRGIHADFRFSVSDAFQVFRESLARLASRAERAAQVGERLDT